MKKNQIGITLGVFFVGLWIVVVATYAAQMKKGDSGKMIPFDAPTSCSSSGTSGGA